MALSFFDSQDSNTGNLPFLNEYKKENKKCVGKQYLVESFTRVSSGKGLLGKTENFTFFIWNNSKTAKLLIEALDYYVQNEGCMVFVIPTEGDKPGYRIAADTQQACTWFCMGNEYTTTEPEFICNDPDQNPFIPKMTAAQSTPTLSLVGDVGVDVSPGTNQGRKGGGRAAVSSAKSS